MTNKSQRRRAKKSKSITLPGGEAVPMPKGPGRPPKEDPMRTVIHARMRRTGIMDPAEARQPICGDDVGLCIRALTTGDERALLVNTWAAISAANRNYLLLIIGQTGTPQGAAIPMISEPMETDPSLRVDLRTHDARVAAARGAWEAWNGKIRTVLTPNLQRAFSGAIFGLLGDGALWRDQQPTTTGKVVVQALRLLAHAAGEV
jgi:hypothetical protein